ncbi:AraC family transcriptional regulator [Desulfovibrio desulfuricans]|uniref:AraC family transcriptional regulator n=1 Tax=Desulfovibrio desulfuricans TaxID=876 RepID=A0A4P7UHG4_DESDE|nr:AraC family transcriptional regulator [Desulfovibrio desulfuricans]QCC85693.1 AraC family transcriptional regulator [Desulfovibrio desulfuricans]
MKPQPEKQCDLLHVQRQILARSIARWTENNPRFEADVPGLLLVRYEAPTQPTSGVYEPCICLVAQGAKRVMLGGEEYVYDANHYLISSVGLPVVANVVEASPEKPLLGLALKLDMRMLAQMMVDSNLPAPRSGRSERGMRVSEVSAQLLSAFQRLLDLQQDPQDIAVLSPLVHKEILYRLLVGEQGHYLRQLVSAGSHGFQIARAIDWLKKNYVQPLKVDSLAKQIGMSTSTFHYHFRAMTAMSPLQYQKWMRLHEARRLMFMERLDATSAAFQVGYESPSQFSREYRRQFGTPPLRDVKNLYTTQEASAASPADASFANVTA